MKSLRKFIETIFAAVTFAEAGEHETALRFLKDSQREKGAAETTADRKKGFRFHEKATLTERLEGNFVAAAFAEAGAFKCAREVLRSYERTQTVLLAIEGEIPTEATFDYALNLCKRINANIDILQMKSQSSLEEDGPSDGLSALLPRLKDEGISYKVTVRRAEARESLYDYVRVHKDVVTAVLDSPALRERGAGNLGWKEAFKNVAERLSVPLVTVSQREPAHVGATGDKVLDRNAIRTT